MLRQPSDIERDQRAELVGENGRTLQRPQRVEKVERQFLAGLHRMAVRRKMRQFLMNARGLTEDEAISLMSIAVDFGITQVVDGNWASTPS